MVCVCVLADMSYRQVTVSRQESQISVKSSSSVELGSLSNRSEVCVCACSQVYHIKHTGKNMKLLQPSMCTAFAFCTRSLYYLLSLSQDGCSSPEGSDPNLPARADKYCCVFLPDGTASLAPARAGLTLRDMLSGLCEKRGFPMKDIVIYLQGKDKVTHALPCFYCITSLLSIRY